MLTVRFTHQTVDLAVLTRCQEDAAAGKFATLTAAYIRWLAPRLASVRQEHKALVKTIAARFREETKGTSVHDRHPILAAELAAGYRPFLRFAVECGAIEAVTAESHTQTIDGYLIELVKDQAEAQHESSPAQRFIALLVVGLRAKRFHLQSVDSDEAPLHYAGACGWHKDWLYEGNNVGQHLEWCIPPNSKLVGFIDVKAGEVYMGSESVKTVAQVVSREQGDHYENPTKIGRDLAEEGLLRRSVEKDADGTQKVGHQIRKRVKDHGLGRYYAIPVKFLFEPDDETAGGVES
jgi:hypothetical protein